MATLLKQVILSQFDASLAMLRDCIKKCPADCWDTPIGKYPFWQVAYHTLCFGEWYLCKDGAKWEPDVRPEGRHPRGLAELRDEYPSRKFTQKELLAYVDDCRKVLAGQIKSETPKSLSGPGGSTWLKVSRAELYIYNLRHIQHHVGQLSAALRRAGARPRWVSVGGSGRSR